MTIENAAGKSLSKMTECFLGFVLDPKENIFRLTQFCGEMLGAQSTMYDRISGTQMTRLGGWNLPTDGTVVGLGHGSLRFDKVRIGPGDIFEIQHSEKPECFFGRIVKDHGHPLGALCVRFQGKHLLSEEDRAVLGIIASALAIEDRRLRSEEIIAEQQLNLVGSARMSALGEMAAGVAHEINNPLMAIILRIDQLKEMVKAPQLDFPAVNKTTDNIEYLAMRISRIIKSLRQFSGDTESELYREVKFSEILGNTLELCGEWFKQHKIDLQVEEFDSELKMKCMPTEMSRVLFNLLQNSFDAVETTDEKWIKIQIFQNKKNIEIKVTDSGIGISKEIQSKIFEPFFSTKEVNRGKGLGLSISKGVMEKHHGTLTFNPSSVHTQFVILVPR